MAFKDYTLDKIKTAAALPVAPDFTPNQEFVADNHWRNGAGWTGPVMPADDPAYLQSMARLATTFRSEEHTSELQSRG